MLAFSNDYYGMIFRATQSVELFCAYEEKAKYEKWRGLDEPEVVYERPSKGSSSVGSDSSSSNFLPEETIDDVSGEEEFFNMRNNPDIGNPNYTGETTGHVDGTISIIGGQ